MVSVSLKKNYSYLHYESHLKGGDGLVSGIIYFLLLIFSLLPLTLNAQTCNPTSYTICANVDDWGVIYIDGIQIPVTFSLSQSTSTGVPCYTVPAGTLFNQISAALTTTANNIFALYDQNVQSNIMLAAWSFQIGCSSGQTKDIASDLGGVSVWYNACGGSTTPPMTSGNWYDTTGIPTSAWYTAINVPNSTMANEPDIAVTDTYTGNILPFLSWDPTAAAASNSCAEFFRQSFTMIIPTPLPTPDITITKSVLGPVTNIAQGQAVTFRLNVCNTGQGIDHPVTILDQLMRNLGTTTTESSCPLRVRPALPLLLELPSQSCWAMAFLITLAFR